MSASKDGSSKPTTAAARAKEAARSEFASVHLWHIQAVRDIAVVAMAVGVFYLGYLMRVVTVPLLLGLLLAYLTEPVVRRIARRTGRSIAVGVVIVAFYVLVGVPLVLGTGLALLQGARLAQEVQKDLPALREKADELLERLDHFSQLGLRAHLSPVTRDENGNVVEPPRTTTEPGGAPPAPSQAAAPPSPPSAQPASPAAPAPETQKGNGVGEEVKAAEPPTILAWVEEYLIANKGDIGKTLAGGGVRAFHLGLSFLSALGLFAFKAFFLVPFFFYFCSVGLGAVARFGVSLIPKRNRDRSLDILSKMDDTISAFIRGRLLICLILAGLFTIGFWIARVPAPLLIGPAVGLLAFVPYLAIVGWLTAMAMLLVTQAGEANPMPWYWVIAGPTIVYWAVQMIDDYVLTPMIQGKRMGLDTPMILVALLGAASIAGVYGVLVAIPAAACLKILIVEVFWPRYKQWAEGKAEDPLPISAE